ncbi:STAS/SEC14 domain-containing protein [Fulvivirga ulvae]|uniref:STAS/SEC14 domain-containing protein n=1 Tax=Fulvivirga ulvae TaxID=2904245 RepID=UPI001F2E8484|nr:STAS/SEC14 domain-containing protein [Fulvivirga ulvae]UII31683.1 STAS/SEC14 domain-containing protein [Fulvivirga ulvae]
MEIELMNEPYVRVVYDPKRFIGKIIWQGNPKPDEYKKPFLKLLEWVKDNKTTRFLSDTRDQGVVAPENRKWFEAEMVPAAIKAGCKRAAVITSGNVFKRYYLNMILSVVNKFDMPFKIVQDEESAIEFLMEK